MLCCMYVIFCHIFDNYSLSDKDTQMTYQQQHSMISFIVKFLIIVMSNILAFLPLANAENKKKIFDHSITENLKIQLLEDPIFLSKLSEKITLSTHDHYIQKVIKDYLLKNPEIMIELELAFQKQLKEQNEKQALVIKLLEKEIFHSSHDAVLGNPNGDIVVVNFFDYNCGYCKHFYSIIMNLIEEYPNLRVIIKDFPILGPDSMAVHTVAYVFRKKFPEKYAQFYKELLTDPSRANKAKAIKVAVSLGANEKELHNMMKDHNLQKVFNENIQIASALNITGTPSFIINNMVFVGAIGKETLKEIIQNMQ